MKQWILIVILVGIFSFLGAILYTHTLESPFIFDDTNVIVKRTPARYASMDILDAFDGRRTLTYYTYGLNYDAHELDPFGYHLVNLVIHVVTSIAVFWLVYVTSSHAFKRTEYEIGEKKISNIFLISSISSLIFLTHPIQTEAVIYVTARAVLLATLFYVITLAAYILWRTKKKWWWAVLALATAYLSIHTKEISFTLPLAIIAIELIFFTDTWLKQKKRILALGGVIIVGIAAMAFFLGAHRIFIDEKTTTQDFLNSVMRTETQRSPYSDETIYLKDFVLTQQIVKARYLQLIFIPFGQNINHFADIAHSASDLRVIFSTIFLLALVIAAIWLAKIKKPLVATGIFFFFIALLPQSSLYILPEQMVEYRLYLPMVGIALIIAQALDWIFTKLNKRTFEYVSGVELVTILSVILIIALSILTYQRNELWTDPTDLWGDAIKKAPKAERAYVNKATNLIRQNREPEAEELLEEAVKMFPDYSLIHQNLAAAYKIQGKTGLAVKHYEKSLELWPENAGALFDLGSIAFERKKYEEALEKYTQAAELLSAPSVAYQYVGITNIRLRRYEAAKEALQKSVEINPKNKQAETLLKKLEDLE